MIIVFNYEFASKGLLSLPTAPAESNRSTYSGI